MGLKAFLPIAVVVFVAATTGADVVALTFIGGEPFYVALREHLYWAGAQFVGTLLLLAPFVAAAIMCALAEKKVRTRSALLVFAVSMLTLLYFYFQGYQAAERAALKQMWTGATLSIALLPFLIGVPVVLATWAAGEVAAKFDPRVPK